MYLTSADNLHGSPFMSREPTVSKRKHRETVKKRDPYAETKKIRKNHPNEEWLKMRKKMDDTDLRKKTETNVFAEILSKVMPRGQASNVALMHLRLKNAPQDTDNGNIGIGYRKPTITTD